MNIPKSLVNKYEMTDCFPRLAQFPNESVDLIFTSMPDITQTKYNKKEIDQYREFQKKALLEYSRIIKPKGHIVISQRDRKANGEIVSNHLWYINNLTELGFKIKDAKIVIDGPKNTVDLYRFTFQYYYDYTREGVIATSKRKGEFLKDILSVETDWLPKQAGQPTWPIEFCEMIIEALTEPGDFVVDPFAALGPVLYAAKRLGRKFWGAELCPERYVADFKLFEDFYKKGKNHSR